MFNITLVQHCVNHFYYIHVHNMHVYYHQCMSMYWQILLWIWFYYFSKNSSSALLLISAYLRYCCPNCSVKDKFKAFLCTIGRFTGLVLCWIVGINGLCCVLTFKIVSTPPVRHSGSEHHKDHAKAHDTFHGVNDESQNTLISATPTNLF